MACYIYQLPAWVLDDLCRNMDTLSEWDWMQFGEWPPGDPAAEPAARPGFRGPRTQGLPVLPAVPAQSLGVRPRPQLDTPAPRHYHGDRPEGVR